MEDFNTLGTQRSPFTYPETLALLFSEQDDAGDGYSSRALPKMGARLTCLCARDRCHNYGGSESRRSGRSTRMSSCPTCMLITQPCSSSGHQNRYVGFCCIYADCEASSLKKLVLQGSVSPFCEASLTEVSTVFGEGVKRRL